MSSIAILTDTNCSLPLSLTEKHSIRQVPIGINFGDDVMDAVFEVDDARLFERIDREGKLPTTSAPSTGKWVEAIQAEFNRGADSAICFTVSSAVSGTYGSALTACELFPGREITVVDTQTLALGQGFMVLAAAEAARAGLKTDKIIEHAFDVQKRTVLYGALSTLKYIAMSGRVGQLAAGFANLLNVKPILTIQGGKLEMLERVRTQSRAWARLVELAQGSQSGKQVEKMAILHVNAEAAARVFEQQLRASMVCPEDYILAELTPGLSVHTGSGIIGFSFVLSE